MKFWHLALLVGAVSSTTTVTRTRDYRLATGASQETVHVTITRQSAASSSTATAASQITAVTDCHFQGDAYMCHDGNSSEGSIVPAPTAAASAPAEYTGCHAHEQDTFCMTPEGEEVQFMREGQGTTGGRSCHFHAGVEHCVGGDEEQACERVDRDYNIPLRIGLLFVILATSAIGSFGPVFLSKLQNFSVGKVISSIVKQFGTGVIISTAFVHLITHAEMMWGNSCLGELSYEATSSAITMAGLFLAFTLEYISLRVINWAHGRVSKPQDGGEGCSETESATKSEPHVHSHGLYTPTNDKLSVILLEAGILFHSILIGITLVVAGDSYFITLFIVILFHQMFEGLALGSRIAELNNASFLTKMGMAAVFAVITPIGMAIGIGVLNQFNGNDPSTIIALGTLDSFSAGVLLWTGIVEMWAHDWLFGDIATAPLLQTAGCYVSFIAGLILMSVLGKWA